MLKYKKAVWLVSASFKTGSMEMTRKRLVAQGMRTDMFSFNRLTKGLLKRAKDKWVADPDKRKQFNARLEKLNPDFIICQDSASLWFITGKYSSLYTARGSIYQWNGVPVLVLNKVTAAKTIPHADFAFRYDIAKLKRWLTGSQKTQPRFNYKVCENYEHLHELEQAADNAVFISTDIESSGKGKTTRITAIGFTVYEYSGKLYTWVIPFVDPTKKDGIFYRDQKVEEAAWRLVRKLNGGKAFKVLQNGAYDSTHLLIRHAEYQNYYFDTMHMMHALWTESPKTLNFITSLFVDYYKYWKDESAGEEKKKTDTESLKIPQTVEGLKRYWLYNALDCYYTAVTFMILAKLISIPQLDYAKQNYVREFRNQMGACFNSSMIGIKCDTRVRSALISKLQSEADQFESNAKRMVASPDVNINSPAQIRGIVYDLFGASPLPRKKKSTDKIVLKIIATQEALLRRFLETVWEAKERKNNISKYGDKELLNHRIMYKLSASVADTGRLSSSTSNFWLGINAQNVPEDMRIFFVPDEGYVMWDFDYSSSDSYFIAHECADDKMINVVMGEKDTHCVHAEHFFKRDYQEIYDGYKGKEEWAAHKVTGVRALTKRASHGANYRMSGGTLYIQMGHKAVLAAAKALGFEDAGGWEYYKLVKFCQSLIDAYYDFYPALDPWLEAEITKAVRTRTKQLLTVV